MQYTEKLSSIISPLISWYKKNKRALPWRDEPTPYHVWISEIMLQQTRIEAVIPYYHRFLSELPNGNSSVAFSDIGGLLFVDFWEDLMKGICEWGDAIELKMDVIGKKMK